MAKKRIAILGDSWSHGEWSFVGGSNVVTHPGLSYFLMKEFEGNSIDIINFGIPGGENLYQLDRLNSISDGKPIYSYFDCIICFWTNPGRDVYNNIKDESDEYLEKFTLDEYDRLCHKANRNYLHELDKYDIPVLLIGGQVSIPEIPTNIKNCVPLIPRVANLVPDPLWDHINLKSIEGELTNLIEYDMLSMIPKEKLHPSVVKENRLKEEDRAFLNYNFFNDLGHANRHLHQLVSVIISQFIKERKWW